MADDGTPASDDSGVAGLSAADVERLEGQLATATREVRQWQGKHDSLAARLEALESAQSSGGTSELPAGAGVSIDDIRGVVAGTVGPEMGRAMRFLELAAALREANPLVNAVDPSMFQDYSKYQSEEAFKIAVEDRQKALAGSGLTLASPEGESKEPPATTKGPGPAPAQGGNTGHTGFPTMEEIGKWGLKEMGVFEAEHPGVLDQLLLQEMPG